MLEVLDLGVHPHHVAHLIGLLGGGGALLRRGLAEIPSDVAVVGHFRAVQADLADGLHIGIEAGQSAGHVRVMNAGGDSGADGLVLDGAEDGLEGGVQVIGLLHGVDAFHLAVLVHPFVNVLHNVVSVGDLLGHAVGDAVDLHAVGLQGLADALNGSGLVRLGGNTIVGPTFAANLILSLRDLLQTVSITALNIEGGQTIGKEHHEAVVHILRAFLLQQVGCQLEASLGIGAAISLQCIDGVLHRRCALRHVHQGLSGIRIRVEADNRNIAGSRRGLARSVLGEAGYERLCRQLGKLQTGLVGVLTLGCHAFMIPEGLPAIPAQAKGASFLPGRITVPGALILHLAHVNRILFVLAADGAVGHGAGGIDDQDGGGLRVGGVDLVTGGDFHVHVEVVLMAGGGEGAGELDGPVPILLHFLASRIVVDGAASIGDLLVGLGRDGIIRRVGLPGEGCDLHQAQAHDQGHQQRQQPTGGQGAARGHPLAGFVISHVSVPPCILCFLSEFQKESWEFPRGDARGPEIGAAFRRRWVRETTAVPSGG